MNRNVVLTMIAALAVLSGCDPFGTDDTSVYVTGTVWEDSSHTIPAEGVTLVVHGDSVNTFDYASNTNADGVFFIEVPVYPLAGEEGVGYTLPGFATMGLSAHFGSKMYVYADLKRTPFVIECGDTLTVWDTDIMTWTSGQ